MEERAAEEVSSASAGGGRGGGKKKPQKEEEVEEADGDYGDDDAASRRRKLAASLHEAFERGDFSESVLRLLDSPWKSGSSSRTLLGLAVRANRIDAVRRLLDRGASATGQTGARNLYTALTHGFEDIAIALVDAGTDANAIILSSESKNRPPLFFCDDERMPAAAKALLSAGAVPLTSAHLARRVADAIMRNDAVAALKHLTAGGFDVNVLVSGVSGYNSSVTLLALACRYGVVSVAQQLLSMGADLLKASVKGLTTPLMTACENGHADIALLLLTHGADPEATNNSGHTAFFYARAFARKNTAPKMDAVIKELSLRESLRAVAGGAGVGGDDDSDDNEKDELDKAGEGPDTGVAMITGGGGGGGGGSSSSRDDGGGGGGSSSSSSRPVGGGGSSSSNSSSSAVGAGGKRERPDPADGGDHGAEEEGEEGTGEGAPPLKR